MPHLHRTHPCKNWVVGKSIFIGALVIDSVEGIVAATEQKSFSDYTQSAVCPVCYFTEIPLINTTAVEDWQGTLPWPVVPVTRTGHVLTPRAPRLETVPPTCARLNSAAKIYDALTRFYASPAICPTLRFLYPVQYVYNVVWPVSDALSLSYNPLPPYVDGPRNEEIGHGNCIPPIVNPPHWECVILGVLPRHRRDIDSMAPPPN